MPLEPRGGFPGGAQTAPPRRAATPPSHRPTWLLMLSSLALGYGGLLLVSGLSTMRDPQGASRILLAEPLPPAAEALLQQLTALIAGVIARHETAIRASAVGSIGVALALLYAAAAMLSRDRHGRTAALAAAWLGIAYQVGSLLLFIPIARDYARATTPVATALFEALRRGGEADWSGAAVTVGQWGIVIIPTLFGMAVSALLIFYFGGRRGRRLYGLEPMGMPPEGD